MTTTTKTTAIDSLEWYDLARIAEVAHPDEDDSPGADFLLRIRDQVAEHWNNGENMEPGGETAGETADGAVPVYTYERWTTYLDLAAWQEDLEYAASLSGVVDMTGLAGLALSQIAERLVTALVTILADDQTL